MTCVKTTVTAALFAAIFLSLTGASAAESSPQKGTININTASAAELEFLPGIGPSKVQAIVAYREKRPFKKVEDIMRVKGIGRKTFTTLRPYLAVSGETSIRSKIKLGNR